VSVARQRILDHTGHIFGYELMYRGESSARPSDDLTGARVLTDAVHAVGLDALTCGLRAFVKLTHHLLVDGAGTLLPPETTVLELPGDTPATDEVTDTCRRLHDAGYMLALDNFQAGSPAESLVPWMRFVKIDVERTPPTAWRAIVMQMKSRNVKLIAEQVENTD